VVFIQNGIKYFIFIKILIMPIIFNYIIIKISKIKAISLAKLNFMSKKEESKPISILIMEMGSKKLAMYFFNFINEIGFDYSLY
jgi:hypothetical protein